MACPSPILIPTKKEHKIRRRIEYEYRSPDAIAMRESSSSDWSLAYFEHLRTPDDVLMECIYLSENLVEEMEDEIVNGMEEISVEFNCHFEMVKNSILMGMKYYLSICEQENVQLLNRMIRSQIRLKTLTDYFNMEEEEEEEEPNVVTLSFDGDLVVRGEVSREVVVKIEEDDDKLDDLKVKVWEEMGDVTFLTFRELILFYFKKRYGAQVLKVI